MTVHNIATDSHHNPPGPWQRLWASQPFLILDGAMATELERVGLRLQGDPLWSARALIEHPELVRTVHLAYARAGADILVSASYQATLPGLIQAGFTASEARTFLRRSIMLAMQARAQHAQETSGRTASPLLVAGAVGPYGAYRADGSEYTGAYTTDPVRLRDFHLRHIEILAAMDVDLLICETIPSLHEGEVLIRILAEVPEIAAWISFSCADPWHVSYGDRIQDCLDLFRDTPHILAGVNCVAPDLVTPLLDSVRSQARGIEVVYANRGEIWNPSISTWQANTDLRDSDHVRLARSWVDQGVRVVGGCCRTTPDFIRALACLRRNLHTADVKHNAPAERRHAADTSDAPGSRGQNQ